MDQFQSDVLQQIIDQDPLLREQMDGFRFYPDTLGVAPTTYLTSHSKLVRTRFICRDQPHQSNGISCAGVFWSHDRQSNLAQGLSYGAAGMGMADDDISQTFSIETEKLIFSLKFALNVFRIQRWNILENWEIMLWQVLVNHNRS
jgi:hypothetical protein